MTDKVTMGISPNPNNRSKGLDLKKAMKKSIPLSMALFIALDSTIGVALIQQYIYKKQIKELLAYKEELNKKMADTPEAQAKRLEAEVLSEDGIVLPVKWGDVGKRLVELGVIDQDKFMRLFKQGPLSSQDNEYTKILSSNYDQNIVVNAQNSRFVLNTLWALGLAQRSTVLAETKAKYDKVQNLASTGGWTIAKGNAMEYYGKYDLVNLTPQQQEMVKRIASSIYRPCCNNSAGFPDCNHGMAMLGLIEMMVANGSSEEEIYEKALAVNSMWFPDTYLTIAKFKEDKEGTKWADVDAKEVLGAKFSSGSGYRSVLAQVNPVQGSNRGGGCGV